MPPEDEKIIILDRGNVEFAYPRTWSVKPDPAGFMKLEDPGEDCLLEVSYMHMPPLLPGAPDVAERLRIALREHGPKIPEEAITHEDRGDLRLAWADFPCECRDHKQNRPRPARGRYLVAENGRFQTLMTYHYWPEGASWAVPAWERIVATLRLRFGEQLSSPEDHWSLFSTPVALNAGSLAAGAA